MGLLIADHLQPVLDPAQEEICVGEVVRGLRLDPSPLRQLLQRLDGAAQPELGMAARGDKLLGLREELDIADAAAPELDIVACDRDLAVALMGMHAPLHGVDVGDGREVEIFAPDEGRELAQELFARVDIAGNDARLDQGGALPVLAEAFVVGEACVGGERDLRRPRVGAEPQIRAEHITVAGMLLEQPHQLARQPHEEGRRLDVWREARPRRRRRRR